MLRGHRLARPACRLIHRQISPPSNIGRLLDHQLSNSLLPLRLEDILIHMQPHHSRETRAMDNRNGTTNRAPRSREDHSRLFQASKDNGDRCCHNHTYLRRTSSTILHIMLTRARVHQQCLLGLAHQRSNRVFQERRPLKAFLVT